MAVYIPAIADDTETIDGVTYDIVTISVNAPNYDTNNPPRFARVKYNKLCPVVITSDDMGAGELIRNWAYFNGYPIYDNSGYGHVSMGDGFLETPYNAAELSLQVDTMKRDGHQPLTYSDGTGGVRRFTGTSAIWPHFANNNTYTMMNGTDAKTMIRTGWSFAQHDVDKEYATDAATIASRFATLSETWATYTGIGLKVMVEPAGEHKYIDAGKNSNEICWNIFQNGVVDTYPELPTPFELSLWTSGNKDWTTFDSKPAETTTRFFFQGHESTFADYIANADGNHIIMGGTHGMNDEALLLMKEISEAGSHSKKDQFWVTGADEMWEYYHLYNNAHITDVSYSGDTLTFKVKIPRYKKSQFRELTINIPGITSGTTCTFSDNVVTGSYYQNDGQYTINLGLESKTCTYIEELISYYRSHFHNTYVKDDAQYLINTLKPGTTRDSYQTQLDAEPNYSYTVKSNHDNLIASGSSDEATAVSYGFPKYELVGTDLYQTIANSTPPYYVNTFTPEGKNQVVTINYGETPAVRNVVYYCEGENLPGAIYHPGNQANISNNGKAEYYVYRYSSNGAGGIIKNTTTVTTLQPGRYKLVVGNGDSNSSATYTFMLGNKNILSYESSQKYASEHTKEDIIVKAEQTLTVSAVGGGDPHWIDYIYIQKTGDYDTNNPDVQLTSTTTDLDATNGNTATLTATATGKNDASITHIVIKDADGTTVASAEGSSCTYEFTPTALGTTLFTAEGTDNNGKTGLSDDLSITVRSDFTLTATSNLGDDLGSTTLTGQSADKNYRFMYPRYLLKGTTLYETEARSTNDQELHYGETIAFTLANKTASRTVSYQPVAANIVYYTEGEDISGSQTITWTADAPDYNKGEYYALSLGSKGACGGIPNSSTAITTLPAGTYHMVAGIGLSLNASTWTFNKGDSQLGTYSPTAQKKVNIYTSDEFTLDEETAITVASAAGKTSSQTWLDFVYFQKLGTTPITVGTVGIGSFASPYVLDFTNSNIKAYRGEDGDGKVMLYPLTMVPAGEGLFLEGTKGTAITEYIPLATSVPEAIEKNDFVGVLETTEVEAGNYVLSVKKDGSSPAFRRLASATSVPAGHSYLRASISKALSVAIEWEDNTTGIHIVESKDTNSHTSYNLKGIPVNNRRKGLIINNGKIYFNK